MRKLTKYKIITISCKCGTKLLKYKKGPGRTLIKIHSDRITKDFVGIFMDDTSPEGSEIICPTCNKRFATVRVVNGKYVNKVNRGRLGIIRKS